MLIQKAIYTLLRNTAYFDNDANRQAVADSVIAIPLFVGMSPQELESDQWLHIAQSGGENAFQVNHTPQCAQTVIELSSGVKNHANKAMLEQAEQAAHNCGLLLNQWRGTVQGVEIIDLVEQTRPNVITEQPRDRSDSWVVYFQSTFNVTHRLTMGSTIN